MIQSYKTRLSLDNGSKANEFSFFFFVPSILEIFQIF